ncbi:hypothetical protein CRM81_05280 [Yersinia kristensenii]|nr:hypothetical protein CRM81_05280 [Yersinia kristensenii]
MCVGCTPSPESLTDVNSSGFIRLPPSCNSNYLEYILVILQAACALAALLTRPVHGLRFCESHSNMFLTDLYLIFR